MVLQSEYTLIYLHILILYVNRCVEDGLYTDDETSFLTMVNNALAWIECFHAKFEASCGLYVSNTLDALAEGAMMVSIK